MFEAKTSSNDVELVKILFAAAVNVLRLSDELNRWFGVNVVFNQDLIERFEGLTIDDKHFVLIKLNFLSFLRVNYSDPRTAIVEE